MASTLSSPTLIASFLLLLLISQSLAATAPAPAPAGPLNFTGILDKKGQYTTFIRLLILTQVASQINNQLNSSFEGLTVFAPTDKAFAALKAGTLNSLTVQELVTLVLNHVLPKYYTLASFLTVSNPVRTQATGQDGGAYGLNFTGSGNQVSVSTGIVSTPINNALLQKFPLAIYQVDKVLFPNDLFGVETPALAPPPAKSTAARHNKTSTKAASSPDNRGVGSIQSNVGFLGLTPASAPTPEKSTSASSNETTAKAASSPDNGGVGSIQSNVGFLGLAPASAPTPTKSTAASSNEATAKAEPSPDNGGVGSIQSNVRFLGLALGFVGFVFICPNHNWKL